MFICRLFIIFPFTPTCSWSGWPMESTWEVGQCEGCNFQCGQCGQCEGCHFQWLLNHLKRWLDGFCWSNLGEKRKAGSKLSQEWLPQKSGLRLQVFQGGLKMNQCSQFSILLSHWCREIHNLLVIQPEYSWITDHHHSPSCWESLCGCRPFILILIFGRPPDISYWYLIFGYLANHLVFNIW